MDLSSAALGLLLKGADLEDELVQKRLLVQTYVSTHGLQLHYLRFMKDNNDPPPNNRSSAMWLGAVATGIASVVLTAFLPLSPIFALSFSVGAILAGALAASVFDTAIQRVTSSVKELKLLENYTTIAQTLVDQRATSPISVEHQSDRNLFQKHIERQRAFSAEPGQITL